MISLMDQIMELSQNFHAWILVQVATSDCNPGIPNPGIPAILAIPESQDWQHPNPKILGLQKFDK